METYQLGTEDFPLKSIQNENRPDSYTCCPAV